MCIFNAPIEVRAEFVRGYRVADGTKTGPQRADCKGKIGCQGLYYLFCSLGENVSINTRESKSNIFRLNSTRGKFRKNPTAIKKIIDLGYNDENEFVYDIETTEGRFSGGVGSLILKNTDSSYIFFPDVVGKTREETAALLWDHSEVVADDLTSIFPPPMKLEFEEVIYHDFLILSKKRYVYTPMKRDGKLSSKVGNKGVLLSRRDNSDVVRDVYAGLVKRIFNRLPEEENLNWLVEKALEMFQKQVPIEKFTITKKIGEVGSLPLLTDCNGVCQEWVRSIESGGGNQSEEMKKILESGKVLVGDYTIPKLSRDPKERARQLKLKNSSSPVEYYTNSLPAHVSLAMKMRARGTRVDNGTRLLHIVIEAAGHKDKLFNKIEDVEYLQKHTRRWALDGMRVDGLYYLKAMTKSIDQVLNACYESKSAKNFMTRLYKHWLARYDTVNKISPYTKIVFNDQ
jgi:hypothetical protein